MNIRIPANYYQQFDADYSLETPAEGYGGWNKTEIEISCEHTALVVMHAWDTGTYEQYPGWHKAVEYIPRADKIAKEIFPRLLSALRSSGMKLFHVAGGGDYYKKYPGCRISKELAEEPSIPEQIEPDVTLKKLRDFRAENVFVGRQNQDDVNRGIEKLDFMKTAMPLDNEPIAGTSAELFALCRKFNVNHLIYAGFAINWCLLLSPGGMADMSKHGIMCSAIRQATTAVENKETARRELCKELGLWRTALAFGFVFDLDDFIKAIASK